MGNTFGRKSLKADVAQLVEQPIRNRQVSGSSPLVGSSSYPGFLTLRPAAMCTQQQLKTLRRLLSKMQPRTVLFFPLFDGENSPAKTRQLYQFLLDCLKPFLPLAVSDMSLCVVVALTPILFIRFFELSDLVAETADLFAKHC